MKSPSRSSSRAQNSPARAEGAQLPGDDGKPVSRDALEPVADLFRVFSEATRLAILKVLMGGSRSVNELVEELGAAQANVSKQLRILYDARILAREKRGNQVFYSIADEIVYPLCELVCGKLNRDAKNAGGHELSM